MVNHPDAAHQAASVAQWGGSAVAGVAGASTYFGLTSSEWTIVFGCIGACVAVMGFAVNTYFLWKRDRREARVLGGD
jgi:hypothetical protein